MVRILACAGCPRAGLTALVAALALACASPQPAPEAGDASPHGHVPPAEVVSALVAREGLQLIDLTHALSPASLYWPTGSAFEHERVAWGTDASGDWYAAAAFRSPEHLGTHLDAPIHFAEGRHTSDQVPVDRLVGAGVVIDIAARAAEDPDASLTPAEIEAWERDHGRVPGGAVVIVRTGWAARWPDWERYYGSPTPKDVTTFHFPGVSAEAASVLLERGVAGVGIDTASIDPGTSVRFEAHRVLAPANIFNLENLTNVDVLPATGLAVIALPMKIEGGTGGPTRVVALVPDAGR